MRLRFPAQGAFVCSVCLFVWQLLDLVLVKGGNFEKDMFEYAGPRSVCAGEPRPPCWAGADTTCALGCLPPVAGPTSIPRCLVTAPKPLLLFRKMHLSTAGSPSVHPLGVSAGHPGLVRQALPHGPRQVSEKWLW